MLPRSAFTSTAWLRDNIYWAGTRLPLLYRTSLARPYTQISHDDTITHNQNEDSENYQSRSAQSWNSEDVGHHPSSDEKQQSIARPRKQWDRPRSKYIPFQRSEDEIDLETSTITPREKAAFKKLFKLSGRTTSSQEKQDDRAIMKGKRYNRELDIDALLDNAVQRIRRPSAQFPKALQPMAEEARNRRRAEAEANKDAFQHDQIQQELERVHKMMDGATTDVMLWNVLKLNVFNRVVALHLDPPTTPEHKAALSAWKSMQAKTKNPAPPDIQVMTANFPLHLLHFMNLIRTKYPSSMLGLTLLPDLKRLGPSAFALGATTALYNAHMRALYDKYPNELHNITDVLMEMDREVYEFNEETENLLIEILLDAQRFCRGERGPALKALWTMDRMKRALKNIIEWRELVEDRRQGAALKAAREEETLREVVLEGDQAEGKVG
ncbi:hypothetical protein M433DRAFT_159728 [Acidomyces richmondensis BFW]|nr:MAG: hypothetical protein FE78DRAFT_91101 [Acidomyces sp. 'richmondensis']KYG40905.1 hypothetical protein M433DRAFT_159728 [Acidomyces richmondensis BFW]